jgi:hypothetical protein
MKSEYINHIRKTEVSLEELSKMNIFCFLGKPINSYSAKELLSTYLSSCTETINDSYINIRIENGYLKYDEDCNHKQFQNKHIFLTNEPFYVSDRRNVENIVENTIKSKQKKDKDCKNYKFTYSQIKEFIIDINQNKEDIIKDLYKENYLVFEKCCNIRIDKDNYLETTLLFDYIIEPIDYE